MRLTAPTPDEDKPIYAVRIEPQTWKLVMGLGEKTREAILSKIEELEKDPCPRGVEIKGA